MIRILTLAAVLASALSVVAAPKPVRVTGPTVIAFFPPVTPAELEKDTDTNDALDDFQWYAREVRKPFADAGIRFLEVYAKSFRVSLAGKVRAFHPKDAGVGYYFIMPGKKPLVTYGVDTSEGLAQTARKYFSLDVPGLPRAGDVPPN